MPHHRQGEAFVYGLPPPQPEAYSFADTSSSGSLPAPPPPCPWPPHPPEAWDAQSPGPPPTHEVPLREMQRLLGETWKYHQRGELASMFGTWLEPQPQPGCSVAVRPAGPPSPRGTPREPPPICSDLLEVREPFVSPPSKRPATPQLGEEAPGSPAIGEGFSRDLQSSSPGYVFLGRLVATLPEDEVRASGGHGGPCPPQAVVECNFWQLRGLGRAGVAPSAGGPSAAAAPAAELAAPAAAPPRAAEVAPPRPLDRAASQSGFDDLWRLLPARTAASKVARHVEEEDEDLPPWPHEM